MRSDREYHTRAGGEEVRSTTCMVVGAGVSGCACATLLASSGVRVTLVNSALDAVGQPAYGPLMCAGARGWAEVCEVMRALPPVVRDVWLHAGRVSTEDPPVVWVDRRMLGIEMKRALECVPGLELRQGLVSDVRWDVVERVGRDPVGDHASAVRVETAFGDELGADAVVVAVGLSLRGRVSFGSAVTRGGRCGETPSEGLYEALAREGADYQPAEVVVGPSFVRGDLVRGCVDVGCAAGMLADPAADLQGGVRIRAGGCRRLGEALVDEGIMAGRSWDWPAEYPPSPYRTDPSGTDEILTVTTPDGELVMVASPDGTATGETYLWMPGRKVIDSGEVTGRSTRTEPWGHMTSRPAHTVQGMRIMDLDENGRLIPRDGVGPPIWITGRAGGAASYLGSLRSGVRTANAVMQSVAVGTTRRP